MTTKLVDIRTVRPDLKELLSLVEEGTEIIFLEMIPRLLVWPPSVNELPVYTAGRSRSIHPSMNRCRMISGWGMHEAVA